MSHYEPHNPACWNVIRNRWFRYRVGGVLRKRSPIIEIVSLASTISFFFFSPPPSFFSFLIEIDSLLPTKNFLRRTISFDRLIYFFFFLGKITFSLFVKVYDDLLEIRFSRFLFFFFSIILDDATLYTPLIIESLKGGDKEDSLMTI